MLYEVITTLVLVDGRRVNAIDLSGTDWLQIPLDQIERIEIIRGTGSVLYGDNATGGVINILTKVPTQGVHATAGLEAGSYDANKQKVSLSASAEDLAVSLYASRSDTDGYRQNNDLLAKDLGAKLTFFATDALTLRLNGSYHYDDYGMPGALTARITSYNVCYTKLLRIYLFVTFRLRWRCYRRPLRVSAACPTNTHDDFWYGS